MLCTQGGGGSGSPVRRVGGSGTPVLLAVCQKLSLRTAIPLPWSFLSPANRPKNFSFVHLQPILALHRPHNQRRPLFAALPPLGAVLRFSVSPPSARTSPATAGATCVNFLGTKSSFTPIAISSSRVISMDCHTAYGSGSPSGCWGEAYSA
jgi:hypothetical protein